MYGVKEAASKLGISDSHCQRLLEKRQIEGRGLDWLVLSLDYKRKRSPKTKKGERHK
jgi:hypothetical protein